MEKNRFSPVTATVLPRFAGIATFMRLPYVTPQDPLHAEVDIGLVGIPWDGGTTNRAGARHGPRHVRDASTMTRNVNRASGINPFALCNCADLGDTPVNPVDLMATLALITDFYTTLHDAGIAPLSVGGDHLVSLPVLRALAKKGPIGMVHFDAHTDTWDRYFGDSLYTHGTPFRRAIEENLLDPKRIVQIGIRGAQYNDSENDWGERQGIRVIDIDEFHALGVPGVLAEARRVVGDLPTYVSFDVDALDPVYAPGTGTPEIGGLTTYEAQQLVRGLCGLNLVGGDLVEVSPPFDQTGNTAFVGATLLYEILCVLAQSIAKRKRDATRALVSA
ncbi:guanidinopropionase [Paraburkholderia tropica]|uniref:agmatinase n=1 Tax=Paraburkholderia tropica TaxID=92647 RepID=UPI00161F3FE8|nr:agmatinase [Paraburkholderia tropica]MBB3003531.1 guanidinopropionase [Paraburkholderia tropica]MBB6322559.1 guanidinopropionase [Paraburkholderia tropica]